MNTDQPVPPRILHLFRKGSMGLVERVFAVRTSKAWTGHDSCKAAGCSWYMVTP